MDILFRDLRFAARLLWKDRSFAAAVLLTLALLKQQPALKLWLYPGLVAWMLGLGLSVAIALQMLKLAEYFTAASMVLSTGWFVLIAWKLWGGAHVRRA